MHIAVKQQYAFGMLIVSFSDGSQKVYDAASGNWNYTRAVPVTVGIVGGNEVPDNG